MDREIDEILRRIDQHPSRRRRSLSWRLSGLLRGARDAVVSQFTGVSLGQLMIASFLIICVAYFFRGANPPLMRWVIIAGLVLFLTAFVASLRRGGSSNIRYERRWRGQRIDYDEPGFTDRLKSWWDRRSRR
jgi:hypothetical protein